MGWLTIDQLAFLSDPFGRVRALAVLIAYLDESHDPDPTLTDVFAVAGYVATLEEWKAFILAWQTILASEGIDVFHMSACMAGRGKFCGWDDERRNRFLERLIQCIADHVRLGLACAVVRADYDAIVKPAFPKGNALKRYYNFCFRYCLEAVAEHWELLRLPPGDTASWVLEEFTNVGSAIDYFLKLRKLHKWETLFPTVIPGVKDFPPLQAADILVYESMRHIKEQVVQSRANDERWMLTRLRESGRLFGGFHRGDELRKAVKNIQETGWIYPPTIGVPQ